MGSKPYNPDLIGFHPNHQQPVWSQPTAKRGRRMPEQLVFVTEETIDPLPSALDREIPLSDNALTVLRKRYLMRGLDGEPVETPAEMFWRVARVVAAPDAQYDDVEQASATAHAFYEMLTSFRFMPNSPTFTGAGTPLGQLAACFVLPIQDDMGRDPAGIFSTLRVAALVQQTGGGNGFSFSRLRPKGAQVNTSRGIATGPVGFLRVYDKAFGEIAQGGTRRGANMAVLRVDHPDILDFVRCKGEEGDITNFNISVGITDEFMRAVEADEEYELINPQDGSVWKRTRAREVFDEIVRHAHSNGEPGVLFLDSANQSNPVPHLYELEATNPCLTGDTWITTDAGPLQIENAVGAPVKLLLNGEFHPTSNTGFFPTGERHTIEITTERGFRIKVTPNHPLRAATRMTRYTLESEWRDAGDLVVGDKVLLGNNRQAKWEGKGTPEEGYLLGLLVGDGTITTGRAVLSVWGETPGADAVRDAVENIAFSMPHRSDFQGFLWIQERSETRLTLRSIYDLALSFGLSESFKGISPEIEQASSAFYQSFLQGLFDADGSVIGSQEKGVSVRLSQSNLMVLEAVQRMLHRLGIISSIYQNRRKKQRKSLPNGKGGHRQYQIQAQHELVISRSNLLEFSRRIGFKNTEKAERLNHLLETYQRALNRERFVDRISSLSPNGKEPVYDAHVPGVHAYDAAGFHVHNCGEQWLGPYENCCLGSINLAQHVTPEGQVDWAKLQETVELATQFLDNVVDANKYVPAVPEIEASAHRARRIGLGIMGLGDLMYQVGIRYGSPEGEEFAAQVVEFVRYHTIRTSIERAKARGAFPAIEGSIYDPDNLQWRPPAPLAPYGCDFGRPALNWNEIVKGMRTYGIRNAAQTTVAPTGTIGTVSGCEAYGCEPAFALAYIRHFNDGGDDVELTYTSPLFMQALEQAGLDEETRQRIVDQVSASGSCQGILEVPEDIRYTFVVANDISAEEHVRMQAAIQAFVDNSISKTINFPEEATTDDVARAYQLAWRLGCKGLTVYVTGSREKVVLETKQTKSAKEGDGYQSEPRKPRPMVLHGTTYRTPTPLGTAYITINENGDHTPFEIFANVGKAGSDTAAVAEAIGRLISLALRMPSPLTSQERLTEIIDQLAGIGGGRPLGFGPNRVRSLPDAVAQVLARHCALVEAEQPPEQLPLPIPSAATMPHPTGDLCPDCGQAAYVAMEGCRKCMNCGYSEC
jgi:ribonucleoside-diphosphate reductase alpha chain